MPKNKEFRLDGRVALITGAAGHLGAAMARGLSEAGAHVILNGRDPKKLEALRRSLRRASVSCSDVSKPAGAEALIADVKRRHGRLDVLINNAHAGRASDFEGARWEDFRSAYEVSVQASFLLTQKALPLLERAGKANRGGASVINVASMYGLVSPDHRIYANSGCDNPPFYGAAKAGLLQLTRYAACKFAPKNIRVNSVSPGPFPPDSLKKTQPRFAKALAAKTPLGRTGRAEELRGPVLFLASDASSYVTGANLVVDGGWTAW